MKKVNVLCDYCDCSIANGEATICEERFRYKSKDANKEYAVEIRITPTKSIYDGDFHKDCFDDLCKEILREGVKEK